MRYIYCGSALLNDLLLRQYHFLQVRYVLFLHVHIVARYMYILTTEFRERDIHSAYLCIKLCICISKPDCACVLDIFLSVMVTEYRWVPCITVSVIFCFLWDHWAHHGYFENRIPLKPVLGSVCSLANYSVAYEETQSNRVSDFRDFVYSLFPKAILLNFNFNCFLTYFVRPSFPSMVHVTSHIPGTCNSHYGDKIVCDNKINLWCAREKTTGIAYKNITW